MAIKDGFRAQPQIELSAPLQMSFVRNPEELCRFIDQLQHCFDRNKAVYIDLSGVRELDYDGITVLLSIMVEFRGKRIPFNGNLPKDADVAQELIDSGFFKYLYERKQVVRDRVYLAGSSILTHGYKKVDSKLAERIIGEASETVWGDRRRCPGVQRTLVALMHNTCNHATIGMQSDKHWWLSVKHFREEKRVAFSFVDYGVGVFESLQSKPQGKNFYGVLDKLVRRYFGRDNAYLLKKILQGALHRTSSGKAWRGKGLPGIYQATQIFKKQPKRKISNFAMITNDVYFNSHTNRGYRLSTPFRGTFVYWELRDDNDNLPHVT